MKRIARRLRCLGPAGRQHGIALIETIVALALLGIVGVSFLSSLATSSNARVVADGQATGRILAESQMEYVKRLPYQLSYNASAIPEEYNGYAASVATELERNGQIQRLTVTITRFGDPVAVLEGYKVNR
jgi:type II secretory pathway pseudopilin PulG